MLVNESYQHRNKGQPTSNGRLALGEDVRLESICKRLRPGTARTFQDRHQLYGEYFRKQILYHDFHYEYSDILFSAIYLWLFPVRKVPELPEPLVHLEPILWPYLQLLYQANSTKDIAETSISLTEHVSHVVEQDMTHFYFSTQPENGIEEPLSAQISKEEFADTLRRFKSIQAKETLEVSPDEEKPAKEKMPTWHRESKEQSQGFLQFDLERGVPSALVGDTIRESESGDQAMALVQGSSRASNRNDFSKEDAQQVQANGKAEKLWGIANRFARTVWKTPELPSVENKAAYSFIVSQIEPLRRKLTRTIHLTLEVKKTSARTDLSFGRLGKHLVRIFVDCYNRPFFKKNNPSSQLDAAFVLLVDCSASMTDKMDQTRLAISLFHETLRTLKIPHAVVGFWEDAEKVGDTDYPIFFHKVIDFPESLNPDSGAGIMELKPKQDNRDGYAIRVMTQYLQKRTEKNRVILVFSDGEPAAAAYEQNGILNTYQAVSQARRKAIEVIGVFLANGDLKEEEQRFMQNIYGRAFVSVPEVAQLSQHLTPILRKLFKKYCRCKNKENVFI